MIARYFRRTLAGLALLLLIAGLVLFFTSHLDDFDFDNAVAKELTFTSQGNRLSGTLLLPGNGHPAAIAVIIHGDGPQDRYSDNGYSPLFNTLLDAGIAVFSWDKAGIGNSQGNWLHQSMDDRAGEAVAALTLLQSLYQNTPVQIGFLGFSQAGWMIPAAAAQSSSSFRRPGTVYYRHPPIIISSAATGRYCASGSFCMPDGKPIIREYCLLSLTGSKTKPRI